MKCECVPDLSYFEMLRLIFIGIIKGPIKCPEERQFRRTLGKARRSTMKKGKGGSQVPTKRIIDK